MMKRLSILLILLSAGVLSRAQVYQADATFGKTLNRTLTYYAVGIPNDTIAPPVAYQTYPHLAAKDSVLYVWSPSGKRFRAVGGAAVSGGGGSSYTFLAPLSNNSGVVSLSSVPWSLISGAPTTLAGYGITDAMRYLDTALMLAGYVRKGTTGTGADTLAFTQGLKQAGKTVYAQYQVPMWNANRVQGYLWSPGQPLDGAVPKYSAAQGMWVFDTTRLSGAGGDYLFNGQATVLKGNTTLYGVNGDNLYGFTAMGDSITLYGEDIASIGSGNYSVTATNGAGVTIAAGSGSNRMYFRGDSTTLLSGPHGFTLDLGATDKRWTVNNLPLLTSASNRVLLYDTVSKRVGYGEAPGTVDTFQLATRGRLYKALDSLPKPTLQSVTSGTNNENITTNVIKAAQVWAHNPYTGDFAVSIGNYNNGSAAGGSINIKGFNTDFFSNITTATLTDYRFLTLPNKSGTLATLDDIGTGGSYTLPPATSTTLGGVKIGAGLAVATDGTLTGQPQVRVNSEGVTYSAPRINLIGAGGVTVTATNTASDVDVTITGGGSSAPTITTQATSTTLTTSYETWGFTGSSAATFTLPATGTRYVIYSRGTGTLTISGTIYTNKAVTSITLLNGSAVTLQWDGTYWKTLTN